METLHTYTFTASLEIVLFYTKSNIKFDIEFEKR